MNTPPRPRGPCGTGSPTGSAKQALADVGSQPVPPIISVEADAGTASAQPKSVTGKAIGGKVDEERS